MLPKYENGDVIVVYREQRHPLDQLLRRRGRGPAQDRRALSENRRAGQILHRRRLTSFNAKPINGVKLEWIGEICVTLPRGQIERLRAKAAARARKAARVK